MCREIRVQIGLQNHIKDLQNNQQQKVITVIQDLDQINQLFRLEIKIELAQDLLTKNQPTDQAADHLIINLLDPLRVRIQKAQAEAVPAIIKLEAEVENRIEIAGVIRF
jgi:hypothetical protein